MASNKTGMTKPKGQSQGDLTEVLIKMIAYGVAGGALLIAGAKVLGEKIVELELDKYDRIERQRKADREEVARISETAAYEEPTVGLLTSSKEEQKSVH